VLPSRRKKRFIDPLSGWRFRLQPSSLNGRSVPMLTQRRQQLSVVWCTNRAPRRALRLSKFLNRHETLHDGVKPRTGVRAPPHLIAGSQRIESMLQLSSLKPFDGVIDRVLNSRRQRARPSIRRRARLLHLECLEIRRMPSVITWSGMGADSNWSTDQNWQDNIAPEPGDDLNFAASATSLQPVNDFAPGTSFASITIEAPGYALSGAALSVTGEIITTYSSGTSTDSIDTELGAGSITVASGGELDLNGVLSGSAGLTVSGGGLLALGVSSMSTFTGTTGINDDGTTLRVDGEVGAVQVSAGAVLGGSGTVGDIATTAGAISPGDSPGVLNTGSLTLDGDSTFLAELDGSSPGDGTTGYDQVAASGAIDLAGAALVAEVGGGYVPTPGDQLTIVKNDSGSAVTGNFADFGEGSERIISGYPFRITYEGGPSSQDVVLTAVAPTTTDVSPPAVSSTYGDSVTFSAHVMGTLGIPTGTVTFYDGDPNAGGLAIGVAPVDGQGDAVDAVASLQVTGSPHSIFAAYSPDPASDFASSTTTAPASLTVAPASLTVTGVTALSKVYDNTTAGALDTSSATLPGVLIGDDVNLDSTEYSASFADKNVGADLDVTVSGLALAGADAGNYTLIQPTGLTADIDPAPLDVSANAQTMTYGGTVPDFSFDVTGLADGDTAGTVLSGTLATTASSSSHVGIYPITLGTLVANDNYTLVFTGANLTITPASLTITANDASRVFGAANPAFTASYSGFVSGDTEASLTTLPGLTTSAISTSPVGNYTIDISGAGSNDYTFTYVPGTLVVGKASTSATLSGSLSMSAVGQTLTYAVHVAPLVPGAGSPAGTVTLMIDGSANQTVALDAATGLASFAIKTIGPGAHSVMANYSGDSSFEPGQSSPTQLAVSAANTQSILTAQAVRNRKGQIVSVILASGVLVVSPGTGVPLGAVAYFRNGHKLIAKSLANGRASLTLKANQALNRSFTIQYLGDANDQPSTSQTLVLTRNFFRMAARNPTSQLRGFVVG
jgi:hypothetical protein